MSFGSSKPILEGYTDANMAGDLDGRKSTSRYLFMNAHLVYKTLVNVQTPQLQNYQHKFILKQYMYWMINISYTQTGKLL